LKKSSVNLCDAIRSSAANGRLWAARAGDWADVQEGQCSAAYEAVLDQLSLAPGSSYCDVGCGAGMAAQLAARRGAEVAGVDAAAPLLAIARERVAVGDFRLDDLEELPFADGRFDFVTGFNAFQLAANPVAALVEARRVAKPNGRIVVLTWGSPQGMDAAALAPFRYDDGSYRLGASFRWLLAAP